MDSIFTQIVDNVYQWRRISNSISVLDLNVFFRHDFMSIPNHLAQLPYVSYTRSTRLCWDLFCIIFRSCEQTSGRTDVGAEVRTGGRMGGRTGGRADGYADGRADGRTDGMANERAGRRAGERTIGRKDGRMADGRADVDASSSYTFEYPINRLIRKQ